MNTKMIFTALFLLLALQSVVAQESPKDSVMTLKLNEVTITAAMPQIKKEGSVSTVRVKGSILSRMGDASTMLAHTPGLHRGASGIEVNGLGEPIFILDGREIDAGKVLGMLKANTVKEIRIDRAPDLRYSADGRPTVEIILHRPADDYLSLSVGDDMAMRRKFSNAGHLNFGVQLKKFTSTLDYMGGVTQYQNRETYFRSIYRDGGVSVFDQRRTDTAKDHSQRVRWASDYYINPNHRIGWEYYYQFDDGDGNELGTDYYRSTEGIDSERGMNRLTNRLSNLHNFSFMYYHKGKNGNLTFTQDYGTNSSSSDVSSYALSEASAVSTYSKNRYHIATSNLKFSATLPLQISLLSGVKYTYVKNNSRTWSDNANIMEGNYDLSSDIREHNPQAFLSLSRKIKKVTINAGVRYQYLHRTIGSGLRQQEKQESSQHMSSFFPLLTLNYKANGNTSMYFRYNRYVEQPNFTAINAGLTYQDSLTYTQGNPNLAAAFTDRIAVGVNWREFSFAVRYSHISDPIINVSQTMAENSDVIVEQSVNFASSDRLSLSLGYSKTISKFNVYAEGEVMLPNGKYTFNGIEYKANSVSFNGNINLDYRITPSVGVFTSFNYQGYRTELTLSQKAVNNWSIGVVASLLKNRLLINAAFSDLLNGCHYNNITYRYGNIENGTYGTNDQRGFMLKMSYTLFSKKIKAKASRENNETIQRIY